jgi:hypothetical protein
MEKRLTNKKPLISEIRGKIIVSGKHTVTSIPVIRVLDRVSVNVPAIVVPVHVHST